MKRNNRLICLFLVGLGGLSAQSLSTVTIGSNPTTNNGPIIIVDGTSYSGTQVFTWPTGSKHIVQFPLALAPDGTALTYQSASNDNIHFQFNGWTENTTLLSPTSASVQTITADPTLTSFFVNVSINYRVHIDFGTIGTNITCGGAPVSPAATNAFLDGIMYFDGVCYGNTADIFTTPGSHVLNAFPYPGWVFYGFAINGLAPAYLTNINITTPITIIPQFSIAKRVDFLTNPLGLQVLVDGATTNTPAPPLGGVDGVTCAPDYSRLPPGAPAGFTPLCYGQFDFLPGSVHRIGAPTPQQDSASNFWVFAGFTNGLGQNATYTASMNITAPDVLTANFIPGVHTSIGTNPGGLKVMVDGRDNWLANNFVWGQGETHTINAESPQTDSKGRSWVFQSWSDGGAQSHTISIPTTGTSYIVMANYTSQPQVTINSTPSGLTFNIDGNACTTPCVVNRTTGSQMTVTIPASVAATQASRYDFIAWADGSTATSRQVSFNQDSLTLSATYQTSYLLTSVANPAGAATFKTAPASPDGYFASGTQISVTEVPNGGYKFAHWDGDLSGTFGTGVLTMSTPHNVIADYTSVPYIPPAGIQSAAGPTQDGSVAAGSLMAIYGQNLATAFQIGPTNPLRQVIGNTTITLGTFLLPLVYVSPTLISAQVPWELAPGSYTLTVHNTGQPDVPGTVTVSRNAPVMFTQQNTQNLPLVLALHQDGTLISFTSPAIRGEQITIYATGLGPYDKTSVDAFPAGSTPLFNLVDPISITSDAGQQWQPDWAGAAPGMVGIAAVKLTISNDMPSAANLNFQLVVNSATSPQAVLPLQ
ncbi:MAG TPA: hypothetical protein VKR43_05940 [Bryobacteraceae bacterium]|nr:hypothetical protein [Bryobacteraceae bacterium]